MYVSFLNSSVNLRLCKTVVNAPSSIPRSNTFDCKYRQGQTFGKKSLTSGTKSAHPKCSSFRMPLQSKQQPWKASWERQHAVQARKPLEDPENRSIAAGEEVVKPAGSVCTDITAHYELNAREGNLEASAEAVDGQAERPLKAGEEMVRPAGYGGHQRDMTFYESVASPYPERTLKAGEEIVRPAGAGAGPGFGGPGGGDCFFELCA